MQGKQLQDAIKNECKDCIYDNTNNIDNCKIYQTLDGKARCVGKVEKK